MNKLKLYVAQGLSVFFLLMGYYALYINVLGALGLSLAMSGAFFLKSYDYLEKDVK